MKTNETPWTGLAAGAIDARRVDSSGQRDFFWCLSEDDAPALLLRMTPEMEKRHPLPKMAGLDIRYRDTRAGEGLVVRLREPEQMDLFETLCRDVVTAGEAGNSDQDALDRSIRRTLRWHHLLRAGHSDQLSLEEQAGADRGIALSAPADRIDRCASRDRSLERAGRFIKGFRTLELLSGGQGTSRGSETACSDRFRRSTGRCARQRSFPAGVRCQHVDRGPTVGPLLNLCGMSIRFSGRPT